ncbi:hypothetical protein KJ782_06970 [Patescibacteria group bacterium]|nr:hypothetical protein [Patescibacteria group bacterium]
MPTTTTTPEANYSECAKLTRVKPLAQIIHEFVEWLAVKKGFHLGYWSLGEEYLWPANPDTKKLITEFFEIDMQKVEFEKRGMLSQLSAALNAPANTPHDDEFKSIGECDVR